MKTIELPNEALLPALAEIINTLTCRYENHKVKELLFWLWWTLSKYYDDEEQDETIIDNCKEWLKNPDCFKND